MNGPSISYLNVESYTKKYIEEGGTLCKLSDADVSKYEDSSLDDEGNFPEAEQMSNIFNSAGNH